MIRFAALLMLFAGEPATTSAAPDLPRAIGGAAPDDTQLFAFAKQFCVEMRRHHGLQGVGDGDQKPDAARLRKYFDPAFVKKHNLGEGEFRVQMAPVLPIYNMQIADDRKTILCVVGTKENANAKDTIKEAILLRVIVRDGKLYLSPENGPDPQSKTFTPWILRMKL